MDYEVKLFKWYLSKNSYLHPLAFWISDISHIKYPKFKNLYFIYWNCNKAWILIFTTIFHLLRVLLGIFCAQALKYFAEEEQKAEVPVMFVLDDFWQLGEIPGIVEKVTVAKERRVSCLLTMHTVEDCKRQTKDPGKELLALADAVVYTGSSEPDTRANSFSFKYSYLFSLESLGKYL